MIGLGQDPSTMGAIKTEQPIKEFNGTLHVPVPILRLAGHRIKLFEFRTHAHDRRQWASERYDGGLKQNPVIPPFRTTAIRYALSNAVPASGYMLMSVIGLAMNVEMFF